MSKSLEGKKCPKFKAECTSNITYSNKDFEGKNLVLYFYPSKLFDIFFYLMIFFNKIVYSPIFTEIIIDASIKRKFSSFSDPFIRKW